jgi:exodeoxyribonuclease-3
MFRLVSLNLNGIRSAAAKGFEAWAEGVAADCMGVQEVKAQAETVTGRFDRVAGLTGHFHYAQKKGYSGVGLYTRKTPTEVVCGIGNAEFDAEGRYVEARFDDPTRRHSPKLSIVSCYFPSGSSGEHRQEAKFRFLALMAPHLTRLATEREIILVGDINIAHREIDLKNWKGNRKNSGFLPEERAWMTYFACSIRIPSNTPGGATAARPARRTSAGVSTTTWRRPASPRRREANTSTWNSASATTRPSSSTTTSTFE